MAYVISNGQGMYKNWFIRNFRGQIMEIKNTNEVLEMKLK